MKILQFINHADKEIGGAQKIVHYIHGAFTESRVFGADLTLEKNYTKKSSALACLCQYVFSLLFRRDSVILIHHRFFLIFCFLFKHKKTVFVCHNIFPKRNSIFKINPHIHYISISDDVSRYLSRWVSQERISTVYNGLYLDRQSYKKKSDSNKFIVYFIGRLADQKGIRVFLEAFKLISNEFENVFLRIIGDGEDLDDLLESAKGYSNIEFLGKQKYPFRQADDASMIAIPSLYEGFGLVYYEALEYGHYIFASDLDVFEVDPQDEMVKLFESGNVDAICNAFREAYPLALKDGAPIKKRHRFNTVQVMQANYRRLLEDRYE